jgi:hypothetical protein
MDISLGFVVILTLILFPGLLFRRLYFYGEFSKQFNSGNNLIWLIAVSTIPGLLILISVYWYYSNYITEIDLGNIIDTFKDINNPEVRLTESKETKETSMNVLLKNNVSPFIGFLYLVSLILGGISGRFVRISGIDTRLKLLRFKNYWFYLFNGQHTGFKKMKHLKEKNKKHLFTKADILIDSNSKTHLYSGIIVDYELEDNNSTVLSKVMLQNAERYSLRDGKKTPVSIPGTLLVVDCSEMKNINLTFIYEESGDILKSKIPTTIEVILGLIFILLIPVFIFQADGISWGVYKNYFSFHWYEKVIAFLLTVQTLSTFNPFIKKNDEYQFINGKSILAKIFWIGLMIFLLWLF